jgi:hypothetical protein
LWDNGKNPSDELDRVMEVRAVALKNFGERNIKPGAAMAMLEEALVPVYFFHRYQTEATAKVNWWIKLSLCFAWRWSID